MKNDMKTKIDDSIMRRVERIVDDLRMIATPYDSHMFLLILAAAFRKPNAPHFDMKEGEPYPFIERLGQLMSPVLNEELQLKRYVDPSLLKRVLDLAQEVSPERDILHAIWNRGRSVNRADKMTRTLTPDVARFCVSLVGADKSERVACSFTGAFDFVEALEATGAGCVVEEKDNELLASLYEELFDYPLEVRNVRGEKLLEGELPPQQDLVMSVPIFGVKLTQDALHQLQKKYKSFTRSFENFALMDAQMRARRRSLVVLPAGVVSRTTAEEREFKQALLEEGKIEAVIKLPVGSFENNRLSAVVLVMRGVEHTQEADVFMADCSSLPDGGSITATLDRVAEAFIAGRDSDLFRRVSYPDMEKNSFNLDPTRYVVTEERRLIDDFFRERRPVPLAALAQIIRPQPIPPMDNFGFGEDVREVSISDITSVGGIKEPARAKRISLDVFKRNSKLVLSPGDVLLSVKGSVGHVAIVPEHEGVWLPGQVFVTLRIEAGQRDVTSTYLTEFLRSDVGQALLANKQTYGAVQTLAAQDLRGLPIPIPTPEEAAAVEMKHRQVRDLDAEIARLQGEIGRIQSVMLR